MDGILEKAAVKRFIQAATDLGVKGEKFLFSSTMLSFLTDGWHLFKALMLLFISLAIVTYKPIFGYFDIILFSMTWGIVFEVCYTKILLK